MGRPLKVIDRKEKLTSDVGEALARVTHDFTSEKDYTDWIVDNKEILQTAVGLSGGTLHVNKQLSGANIRPDIVMQTADDWHIFEVKLTRHQRRSHSASEQFNALGQLFRYGTHIGHTTHLYLVDALITAEMVSVVRKYQLPITLIEFNEESLVILPHEASNASG